MGTIKVSIQVSKEMWKHSINCVGTNCVGVKTEVRSLLHIIYKKNLGPLSVYKCTIKIRTVLEEKVKVNFSNLGMGLPKHDERHKEHIDLFNHKPSPLWAS